MVLSCFFLVVSHLGPSYVLGHNHINIMVICTKNATKNDNKYLNDLFLFTALFQLCSNFYFSIFIPTKIVIKEIQEKTIQPV